MFRGRYLRAQEELDNVLGCFDCLRDQKFHFRTSRTTKNKANRSKTQNVNFSLCAGLSRNQLPEPALKLFFTLFAEKRENHILHFLTLISPRSGEFFYIFLIFFTFFTFFAAKRRNFFRFHFLEIKKKNVFELSR